MSGSTWSEADRAQAAASWQTESPVPVAAPTRLVVELSTLRALSGVRRQVRTFLQDSLARHPDAVPHTRDEDAEERLVEQAILVIDELASNALRHGLPPAGLHVCDEQDRWLVTVTDAAPQRLPTPAVDRPGEEGGFGLYVVVALSQAHGVHYEPDRKVVWATLEKPDRPVPPDGSGPASAQDRPADETADDDVPLGIREGGSARGGVLLQLHGQLDTVGAPELAEAVTAALRTSPRDLVLDLTAVTFLGSSGARQLVRSGQSAARAGTDLTVVCPRENRTVWRVFDLLQLQVALHLATADGSPDEQPDGSPR